MLGKIEGKRRRGWQMRKLNSVTDSTDTNLNKLCGGQRRQWRTEETVEDRGDWHAVQSMGSWDSQTRFRD